MESRCFRALVHEVGRPRRSGGTIRTPQRVEHDEVADRDRLDRAADRLDDPGAFVTHDQGQRQLRDAGEHLDIALTDTCRKQPNDDLVGFGRSQFDVAAHMHAASSNTTPRMATLLDRRQYAKLRTRNGEADSGE